MTPRSAWGSLRRAEQLLVVVDVLLVGLLVVLVATAPRGGGGASQASSSATPTATAVPTSDAGDGQEPDVDAVTFALPSGNIACEISSTGVLCSIADFTYAPPTVAGCQGETGHAMRLDADGFRFVCEDDGSRRVPPGAPELAYGERQEVGDYRCASGTDGVTCTDAAGVGFRLARAAWTALP